MGRISSQSAGSAIGFTPRKIRSAAAIAAAGSTTYQIQLIHGYNRGTSLRNMIYDEYRYETKVKRVIPGDNPGITVLVLKELY